MEKVPVYEIAICRIRPEMKKLLDESRIRSLRHLKLTYSGLISISPLVSIENENVFADLCLWESAEHAKEAAGKVMSDPEMKDYFETIESVVLMEHFKITGEPI